MRSESETSIRLGRRAFLKNGVLVLTAAGVDVSSVFADQSDQPTALTIGLVTDLHYADKASAGTRHYRETPDKLAEAAAEFGKQEPSMLVELGDLIDAIGIPETPRAVAES